MSELLDRLPLEAIHLKQLRIKSINFVSKKIMIYGLIDIDNFRSFNLKNGFEEGNSALMKFENLATSFLNPTNWKRLGGDEFLFECQGTFEQNKIEISNLLSQSESFLAITCSIGLVELNISVQFEQIINNLKYNMLIAKANGKNQFCLT